MDNNKTHLFDLLRAAFDRGALGHGLLFVLPPDGMADPLLTRDFQKFQALLMCPERKEGEGPCEQCPSCKLLLHNDSLSTPVQHPDFMQLFPEDKMHYAVEDIRTLLEGFSLTRSLGENRIAWIPQADMLSAGGHSGAANALLKILEEPRPNSFLILVTTRAEALLPTIRSRCQTFRLPKSGTSAAIAVDSKIPEEWGALGKWLQQGALPGKAPLSPADDESFWKDRDGALKEVDQAYEWLWAGTRDSWSRLDRDQGKRVLFFFSRLEECLAVIRGYGNAPLQWLSFRSDAKLDG